MKEFFIDIAVFILGASLAVAVMLIFTGCNTKTVYVDRPIYVKVPIKCQTEIPTKAIRGSNYAITLADEIRELFLWRAYGDSCK